MCNVPWSTTRSKKQLLVIRKFLGIEGNTPIEVINNATLEYEKKSFGKKVVERLREMRKPVVTANGPDEKKRDEKETKALIKKKLE